VREDKNGFPIRFLPFSSALKLYPHIAVEFLCHCIKTTTGVYGKKQ